MLFGDVVNSSGDTASVVRVTVYDNLGPGQTSAGTVETGAPDSLLTYVDIAVDQLLDDGNLTIVDFSSDTMLGSVSETISIGIDLTHLSAGDSVGLMSTTDGDAGGSMNAWELAANDLWFTVEESTFSWDLDVDLAIFPVIDENDPSAIAEQIGLDWSIYPNPAVEQVHLTFPEDNEWRVLLTDLLGKVLVSEQAIGGSIALKMPGLDAGVYLVSISDGNRTGIKRLIKE